MSESCDQYRSLIAVGKKLLQYLNVLLPIVWHLLVCSMVGMGGVLYDSIGFGQVTAVGYLQLMDQEYQ